MKVVYMSLTGQTRKFVSKLSSEAIEIKKDNYFKINEPYILIVPTYAYEITSIMDEFIDFEDNLKYLKGVCGSGNLNFNKMFCFSAKNLSKKYNVPLIHCFEFHGREMDVDIVNREVNEYGKS
ncbi:MAG: class Ib ribonucleoside-diphosphate reductase assembly flavoprotein NrdI [Erysipelotrichaceae bacterium]|nr:class Ib ribonucleoside-diphosphate reductase assembly flavoprotein NrdI [Erysipelotrichaceae bacterium]